MFVHIKFKILFLIFSVFFVDGAIVSQRFTLPRIDYTLINVNQEVSCSNIVACCAICSQVDDCLTVSFKNSEGRCLLGTDRVTHDTDATKYLKSEQGWFTLSKVVYAVFLRRSSLGKDRLTYTGAVSMCTEKGTVVASTNDLLESRSLGLDFCQCSWLSNNKNGFVLQKRKSGCWGSFSTGILYCGRSQADVWCKL